MSTLTAFLIVAVLLVSSLAGTYWYIRRATVRSEIDRDTTVHDVGPDALLLLQDLDAHLDAHAARLAGLYERPGRPNPAWAAGLERLWDAVRDHDTNTPEGDSK